MSNETKTTAPVAVVEQQKAVTGIKRFNQAITGLQMQDYLGSVLGEKKGQFINNVTALVANNSLLQGCEPMTVVYAALKSTALDFPLDNALGFSYVIPYRNGKTGKQEAQWQLGARGIVQLALRSGQVAKLNFRKVYEGELIGEDYITGDLQFKAIPIEKRKEDKVVGYLAYMQLTNGFSKMLYMTKEEMVAHGKRYSKSYSSGPWATNFDAMCEKTLLKRILLKYAPLSVELQNAIKADQSIMRSGTEDYNYDDAPDEQEQIEQVVEDKKETLRKKKAEKTEKAENDIPANEDFDEQPTLM